MEEPSLKKKVARGSLWVFLEQFCVQGINFALGIVLARLLSPDDYGTVALVTIYIYVAQVLVSSGFGQALVQKKEIDDLDINSVFYVSFTVSVVMYAILYVSSPSIAAFYRRPELCGIVRVLSVNLLFFAMNAVQNAQIVKQMRFDVSFRISLVIAVVSAVVGVGFACLGYGVWALVWSSVLGTVAGTVARACFISWYPRLEFSWERVKPLFRYGSKTTVSALVGALMGNIYGPMMAKYYSMSDMAFVNKGRNLPDLLQNNINASLIEVSFPALAKLQDDRSRMIEGMRRLMVVGTAVVFPVMMIMMAASWKLVVFLYGMKWEPCVVYMEITCLAALAGPICAVNQQGVMAIGRSGVMMTLGFIKTALGFLVLLTCLRYSVLFWVLMNTLAISILSLAMDMYCGSRFVGYRIRDQLRDVMPVALICLAVLVPVLLLNLLPHGGSLMLMLALAIVQGVVGIALYVGLAIAFKTRAARELVSIAAPKLIALAPSFRHVVDYLGIKEAQ